MQPSKDLCKFSRSVLYSKGKREINQRINTITIRKYVTEFKETAESLERKVHMIKIVKMFVSLKIKASMMA